MKRFYGLMLTALVVLVAGGVELFAGEPVRIVGAGFEPREVLLGDHFNLNIDVEVEEGCQVAFPAIDESFAEGHIELLEDIVTDTLGQSDGVWRLRKSYRLTSFDVAEYQLDSLGVLYSDGLKIDTAFVGEPLQLRVDIMPVDTAQKTIYDIRQPMQAPLVVEEFSGWVSLGVLALAVLASLIYLVLKSWRARKQGEAEVALPKEAPHIVAIRSLEQLTHQKLWQNGKHKAYWSRLTDILRSYLDGRYGVGAMEMTTDEIIAAVKELEISPKQLADIRELLSEGDLVKFAKHTPGVETNEEAYYKVYYFVEDTKEQQISEGAAPKVESPEVIVPEVLNKEKEESNE